MGRADKFWVVQIPPRKFHRRGQFRVAAGSCGQNAFASFVLVRNDVVQFKSYKFLRSSSRWDGSLAVLCLVGLHIVTTCAQERHAGAKSAVARNDATASESCTMYTTLSRSPMTWHSAVHTPAFVYLLTMWVQLVSFGTLVGPQFSTNRDIVTNTTQAELADTFACTRNLASPICFCGWAKTSNSFAGSRRGVQSISVKYANGPMLERENNYRGYRIQREWAQSRRGRFAPAWHDRDDLSTCTLVTCTFVNAVALAPSPGCQEASTTVVTKE